MATSVIKADAYTTGTMTNLYNPGTDYWSYRLSKTGNFVSAYARVFNIDDHPWGDFFQLPVGFRPKGSVVGMGYVFMKNQNGTYCTPIFIGSDGIVRIEFSQANYATQLGFIANFSI